MKKYCLIGKTLKHSLSKHIYEEFGLPCYDLIEIEDEKKLIEFLKNDEYRGFNVTIPYKEVIMKYLQFIDSKAKAIGAVNTIVKKPNGLYGYNTDYYGLKYGLDRAQITIANKVIAILGSGGASKTAVYLCNELGAKEVIIVSRQGIYNYENITSRKDIEVIINATPVGMYPNDNEAPVCLNDFPNLTGVFDMIYNPLSTNLVIQAREKSIASDNGLIMLLFQAKQAMNLYDEEVPAIEKIEGVMHNIKKSWQNIVFIGMPGSGKSTLSKELSKHLKRQYIDTDAEVEKAENRKIAQILEVDGEPYFRKIESEIVQELSKKKGVIISVGGGAVLSKNNRIALKRNGLVIYVKRDLNLLSTKDRPISLSKGVDALFLERSKIYESLSDIIISNNSSIEVALENVIKMLNS